MPILKPTDDEMERIRTILDSAPIAVGLPATTTLDKAVLRLVDFAWWAVTGGAQE